MEFKHFILLLASIFIFGNSGKGCEAYFEYEILGNGSGDIPPYITFFNNSIEDSENATYNWLITENGSVIMQYPFETIDFLIDSDAEYTFCLTMVDGDCITDFCETIQIENFTEWNCSMEVETITINQETGLVVLEAFPSDPMAVIQWEVNGGLVTGNVFEQVFTGNTNTSVCAFYETPACPQGVEVCTEIVLNVPPACPNEIIQNPSENCNVFGFQLPEGSFGNVIWDFSDAGAEASGTGISHTFPGPGIYTVCANPVSMDCPGICTVVEVLDCSQNCGLEVEVIQNGCGFYVMEAYDYPENAQIEWFVNEEYFNTGHITTFVFEPGEYSVCAQYETVQCPEGVSWCESFLVNCSPECEANEVQFGIDSFTAEGGPTFLNWFIATADGTTVDSGVAQYNNENPWYDGTVCLPDGCYQLSIQVPAPISPEALELSVLSGGQLLEPVGGINNFGNSFFQYFFGVNDDCTELIPPCDASFSTSVTPNGIVAVPEVLSDSFSYTWTVDGNYYSDSPSTTFTLVPGVYELCLSIEGDNCEESSCQTITVGEGQCSTVFLSVSTIGPDVTDLQSQTISVFNSENELVFEFNPNYTNAEAWTFNMCLPAGCYSVSVVGDCCMEYGPNPDTYYVIEMAGEEVVMSPFYQFSPEVGQFEFSVFSDCLEPWDCEMDLFAGNPECELGQFEIGSFVEGAEYLWNFGDGSTSDSGHFVEHQYEESGLYEVCVTYQVPNCNYSITQCAEVEIGCNSDCPSNLFAQAGNECGVYVFETSNFAEGEEVFWSFGDGNTENGGHFADHFYEEPGVYTVIAEYSSNACVEGVTLSATITVQPCAGDCPTQLSGNEVEGCGNWVFETSNFAEGEQVIWQFGDGSSEIGGHFADHHYEVPGVYTVIAIYTSNSCPESTTLTLTIEVEPCEEECTEFSFIFESAILSGGPDEIEYTIFDAFGETYLQGSTTYTEEDIYHDDVACLPDGCYEMVIQSETGLENVEFLSWPLLNGALVQTYDVYYGETGMSYEFSVNSDCNPACTEFNITVFSNPEADGPSSQLIQIYNENGTLSGWAQFEADGPSYQTFSFCLPDGCYSLTNEGDCCIDYGNNFLYYSTDNVSFGDYEANNIEAGSIPFSLNGGCEWDSGCEPVQLTVSGNFIGEAVVEWLLESEEYELTGLLPLEALLNGDFTLNWCLPEECFSLTFQSDGPLPMEALLLQLYAEELQEELGAFEMNFGVDFIQFDFGYSDACATSVSVIDEDPLKIYPNPSNGQFILELNDQLLGAEMFVYDMSGRMVYSSNIQNVRTELDLGELSNGIYQLTIADAQRWHSSKLQIFK